ncbi:hypothetical protein [Cryptosporangium sp. NPDC048952]|uniref:hypothetical protein n=1 Tax=Cryptosporangium sp. NPDC048952 TaxID=3363961 RepID=UPI00371EE01E
MACDRTGRLALFNQALLRMLGSSIQPLDAEAWLQTYDVLGPDGRTPLLAGHTPLARAFAGEVVEGQEMVIAARGLAPRRFVANGRPIDTSGDERAGAVVVLHDVTDAHRAEQVRRTEQAVAQALADATSAPAAAAAAIAAVAGTLGWPRGEFWEVTEGDRGQPDLTLSGRWAPEPRADEPEFGYAVAEEVLRRGAMVVAGQDKVSACGAWIGLPVRSGSRVVGALTFAVSEPDPPHPDVGAMPERVCERIGRSLERRRSEDLAVALTAARRDFDRVIAQVNDYLWSVEVCPDGSVKSVYASPNGAGIFGHVLPADTDLGAVLAERATRTICRCSVPFTPRSARDARRRSNAALLASTIRCAGSGHAA